MNIAEQLINEFELAPNNYTILDGEEEHGCNIIAHDDLVDKWQHKVAVGWYGFDIDNVPTIWYTVIDKFLEWVYRAYPDFEIHQIKLKFGGLRLYLGGVDCHDIISKLEEVLYSQELMY